MTAGMEMSAEEFEMHVADALDEIPEELAALIDNCVILVEDYPPPDLPDTLGLYSGIPLTERGQFYADLPDRILIFRYPILAISDTERQSIAQQLADPHTVTVKAGYASRDFVTDSSSGWAVLDQPAVLVSGDTIGSFREMISTLEKLVLSRTPLVVVAPSIAPDVLATLEVNAIRQTMRLLAVICDEPTLRTVATACRAMIMDGSDRQSGYLSQDHLGQCERWVSSATTSHLIITEETTRESA